MPASIYKPVTIKPLLGIFDNRSNTDEKPPGSFAWKENAAINKDAKLARAMGWTRAWPGVCPKNHDFHDQSVALEDREPMTLLFPSTDNAGVRRLFGATKTRLLVLDESAGDWTEIGSGFGVDGEDSLTQVRFNAAELNGKVFFTNNLDLVQYHDLGSGVVQPIPDLAGALDPDGPLTKAKRVISWSDVILLMNVEEGGTRFTSRIRWSDLKNGISFDENNPANTITDFHDLDYGHEILNAVPIGTALYVFCDRSIWRCSFQVEAGDVIFVTDRVYYEPKNQAKCLAYPNTLVSDGKTARYLGRDGWYEYTPGYTAEPELAEWLHRSTKIIFDGAKAIDPRAVESPIAEFRPDLNEIHLSWPTYDPDAVEVDPDDPVNCDDYTPTPPIAGSGVNRHTLVANVKYRTSDFRDFGSVALANFRSDLLAAGDSNQESFFLSVNGEDWTLKQLQNGYGREMYDPEAETYSTRGYFTILRGVFPFERFDTEKEIASFLAGVIPEDPLDTAVLRLRTGTSDVALDPNGANGRCAVLFKQWSNKPIKCHFTKTAAQYLAANQRPDDPVQWNFLARGRFLYFELTIASAANAAPIGAGLTLSRFEVEARLL